MRRALIAVLLSFSTLAAAGCGAGSGSPGAGGGAAVAPRSTALLARVDTSFGSEQWQELQSLLKLFPAASGLPLDSLRDVVGPETDVLALSADDLDRGAFVGLTQPEDKAQLETLLAKQDPPLVSEQISSWRAVAADRRTIDRLKRARNEGSLAGSRAYKEATAGLPADALATVYADGTALSTELDRRAKTGIGPIPGLGRVSWVAAAVSAVPGGLSLDLRVKGDEIETTPYVPALPAQVPAPIALFVDAKGLDATLDELRRSPALSARLGVVATALGGLLDDAVALFAGEAAFYIRPLPAGPEYTLVLEVADEDRARATLGRLATLAAAAGQKLPEQVRIEGVEATKITIGDTTIYLAIFDGKVVVTSAASGIGGLVRTGPRLADTAAWQEAAADAGLPEETTGIVYADIRRALPALEGLGVGEAKADLEPLRTALVYGVLQGSVLSVNGSVSVR